MIDHNDKDDDTATFDSRKDAIISSGRDEFVTLSSTSVTATLAAKRAASLIEGYSQLIFTITNTTSSSSPKNNRKQKLHVMDALTNLRRAVQSMDLGTTLTKNILPSFALPL